VLASCQYTDGCEIQSSIAETSRISEVLYYDDFKAFTDVSEKPNLHFCGLPDRPKEKSLIFFDASVGIYQLMRRDASGDKL
jgi:hypothetical protein